LAYLHRIEQPLTHEKLALVFAALRDWGYTPPLFATPEELLEGAQP